MRSSRIALLFVFLLAVVSATARQLSAPTTQAPQRDPQAVAVLTQALNAEGGSQMLSSIRDFTATGTVTHFWAGQEVKGTATLRGRGMEQIRLDSNLPTGPRTWTINHGAASLRRNEKSIGVPYQNGVDSGAMNYPFFVLLNALSDPQISISTIEHVKTSDNDALLIRINKNLSSHDDPSGILTRRSAKEVILDPSTFLPITLRSKTYPPKGFSGEFIQEMQFDDFRAVNGVLLPFSLTETISGQKTWTFRADSVVLNTGLNEPELNQ